VSNVANISCNAVARSSRNDAIAGSSYTQSMASDGWATGQIPVIDTMVQAVADRRGWPLASIAAHPGYTRTNLQTAGASLGRDKPKRSLMSGLPILPSQDIVSGTEPLLYAATSPDALNGGYYGRSGFMELVGPPIRAARYGRPVEPSGRAVPPSHSVARPVERPVRPT
jgi:hypothetical protein